MKAAILMSLCERPWQSWVDSVTLTRLYTLNHSGWWLTLSALNATRDMNPHAALKSLNVNSAIKQTRGSSLCIAVNTQWTAVCVSVNCSSVQTTVIIDHSQSQTSNIKLLDIILIRVKFIIFLVVQQKFANLQHFHSLFNRYLNQTSV